MTETAARDTTENVLRGSLLALLAIPLGILAYAIVGGFLGSQVSYLLGVVSAFLPYAAAFLYAKASGGMLVAGKLPVVIISLVAVVLGVGTGLVATVWSGFSAVNHQSGILSAAFATTFARQVASGDLVVQLLLGLGLGVFGIVAIVRNTSALTQRLNRAAVAPSTTAGPADGMPVAPLSPGIAPAGSPVFGSEVAPPMTAPVTPPSTSPSPGIILNGKPLDPDPKK